MPTPSSLPSPDAPSAASKGVSNVAAPASAPASAPVSVPLPAAFASVVEGMPPCVRNLLVDNADPAATSVDTLLTALDKHSATARKAASAGDVLQVEAVLSPAACATLRASVDADRSVLADTVDSGPEHQLNLSREALERLIGSEEARKLWRLPLYFRRWRRESGIHSTTEITDAEAECEAATLQECFVRRYSAETRPLLKFHADAYELTVNVALSSDAAHGGGRLLGLFNGSVQALERAEGGVTVHSSSLLHAVSRMTSGVRYALILFYDRHPGRYDPTRYERRWGAKDKGARWWEQE